MSKCLFASSGFLARIIPDMLAVSALFEEGGSEMLLLLI
jgi:hypothetical protein